MSSIWQFGWIFRRKMDAKRFVEILTQILISVVFFLRRMENAETCRKENFSANWWRQKTIFIVVSHRPSVGTTSYRYLNIFSAVLCCNFYRIRKPGPVLRWKEKESKRKKALRLRKIPFSFRGAADKIYMAKYRREEEHEGVEKPFEGLSAAVTKWKKILASPKYEARTERKSEKKKLTFMCTNWNVYFRDSNDTNTDKRVGRRRAGSIIFRVLFATTTTTIIKTKATTKGIKEEKNRRRYNKTQQ